MNSLIGVFGEILLEGLKFLNIKAREKLQNDHHDAIADLNMARNANYPEYTDIDLALAKQRLDAFARAYLAELKNEQVKMI